MLRYIRFRRLHRWYSANGIVLVDEMTLLRTFIRRNIGDIVVTGGKHGANRSLINRFYDAGTI